MGRNFLANLQEMKQLGRMHVMLAYVSLVQKLFRTASKHGAQSPGLWPGLEQLLLEQLLGWSWADLQTLAASL